MNPNSCPNCYHPGPKGELERQLKWKHEQTPDLQGHIRVPRPNDTSEHSEGQQPPDQPWNPIADMGLSYDWPWIGLAYVRPRTGLRITTLRAHQIQLSRRRAPRVSTPKAIRGSAELHKLRRHSAVSAFHSVRSSRHRPKPTAGHLCSNPYSFEDYCWDTRLALIARRIPGKLLFGMSVGEGAYSPWGKAADSNKHQAARFCLEPLSKRTAVETAEASAKSGD